MNMKNNTKQDINLILIRITTITIIILAVTIAGIHYGAAKSLSGKARDFFHELYMWFEHVFRAFTVFVGSFLTWRFLKKTRGEVSHHRRTGLISFSISSLIFLVIWPLVTGYWELYNVLMPFPWSTLPFQMAGPGTLFGKQIPGWLGIDSVTLLLWGYFMYQIIVLAGTIILGRKWQCSMICLMNGCHAESLGIALPLVTHNKKPGSKQIHPVVRKGLRVLQVVLFSANMLLILLWSIYLFTGTSLIPETTLISIESLKYTSLELTLFMFLWLVVGGRGYCYYCPAGFALGIIGNMAGQRIETGLTYCTKCGACNDACKLSIDIREKAIQKKPVKALQCVGCGLCTDSCPTGNLRYTTYILDKFRSGKR
jgi:ferredoxin-type protein NapH